MKLCHVNDLANQTAKSFTVAEKSIFAVKKDSDIFVYLNSCPHLDINLEFLENEFLDDEKNYIQCSNHGALFHIDSGECIVGPCSGQFLKKIPCEVDENGNVILQDKEI